MQYIRYVKSNNKMPGYYFFLLTQRGFTAYDISFWITDKRKNSQPQQSTHFQGEQIQLKQQANVQNQQYNKEIKQFLEDKENGHIPCLQYFYQFSLTSIFCSLCYPNCLYSLQDIEKIQNQLHSHSNVYEFQCPKCNKIKNTSALYYDPSFQCMLIQAYLMQINRQPKSLYRQSKQLSQKMTVRIADSTYCILPFQTCTKWQQIKQKFKGYSLTPSQHVKLRKQLKDTNQQNQEFLKNFLQFQILPNPRQISYLATKKDKNKVITSLLTDNKLFVNEKLNKVSCYLLVSELLQTVQLKWMGYCLKGRIFVGVTLEGDVWISQLDYDQIAESSQQDIQKSVQCQQEQISLKIHRLVNLNQKDLTQETQESQETKIQMSDVQVYSNLQQLFIVFNSKIIYFRNILLRSQPQVIEQEKGLKKNMRVISTQARLWQYPVIIWTDSQNKSAQLCFLFDKNRQQQHNQTMKIKMPNSVSLEFKLDYFQWDQNDKSIINLIYNNQLIQINTQLHEVDNVVPLETPFNQPNLLRQPTIHKSYLEYLSFQSKQEKSSLGRYNKVIIQKQSLFSF